MVFYLALPAFSLTPHFRISQKRTLDLICVIDIAKYIITSNVLTAKLTLTFHKTTAFQLMKKSDRYLRGGVRKGYIYQILIQRTIEIYYILIFSCGIHSACVFIT